MQVVALSSVAPQPWRNGAGSTCELWAGPAGDDWRWRVSVATIERDGPFSAYPGVERHFAVLRGAGVRLRFAGGEQHCTVESNAVRFDGEDAPQCELIDGATLDLNLMVRGGIGQLRRVQSGAVWLSAATHRAVWCGRAVTLHVDERMKIEVPDAALVYTTDGAGQLWRLSAVANAGAALDAWWIGIESIQS